MSAKPNNEDREPIPADAEWSMSLDCECPHCHEHVDLLQAPDFWDGCPFEAIEHGTPATKGAELMCPECRGIIKATLHW